ncbi:MAG: hypothetical protein H0W72_02925 [Planctomycetes bacterium]|nr:hypothetical protein [Planctomycetota bacterium]
MTPAEIQAIADHVALALWNMGHRDPVPFAREFAASPAVHRSLAQQMRNDPPQMPADQEAQQMLEWAAAV